MSQTLSHISMPCPATQHVMSLEATGPCFSCHLADTIATNFLAWKRNLAVLARSEGVHAYIFDKTAADQALAALDTLTISEGRLVTSRLFYHKALGAHEEALAVSVQPLEPVPPVAINAEGADEQQFKAVSERTYAAMQETIARNSALSARQLAASQQMPDLLAAVTSTRKEAHYWSEAVNSAKNVEQQTATAYKLVTQGLRPSTASQCTQANAYYVFEFLRKKYNGSINSNRRIADNALRQLVFPRHDMSSSSVSAWLDEFCKAIEVCQLTEEGHEASIWTDAACKSKLSEVLPPAFETLTDQALDDKNMGFDQYVMRIRSKIARPAYIETYGSTSQSSNMSKTSRRRQ